MGRERACWEEGAPPAGSAQAIPCFQLQNSESREEVGDMNGLEVYISHGSYSDRVDSCPPVLKVEELNESHMHSFNKYLVPILCQALS